MSSDILFSKLYAAFLKSALAMGDDIKKLSWFGKYHTKKADETEAKKAA